MDSSGRIAFVYSLNAEDFRDLLSDEWHYDFIMYYCCITEACIIARGNGKRGVLIES